MKTAARMQAIATTGEDTWSMARMVASRGAMPSSILRCTASTTTIASSTTMPMDSTRPNMLVMLIEKPSNGNRAMAPITATGTVSSGISGQIFRQFALTIASSVLLSAFSALSLSPALSAMLLKPHAQSRGPLAFCFARFNRGFEWARNRYLGGVGAMIRRSAWAMVALGLFWVAGAYLFKILPAGFLPDEDQAAYFVPIRLPDGASIDRTDAAVAKIEERLGKVKGVQSWFVIGGTDFTTQTNASNVATMVVITTPWEERKTKDLQLDAILAASQRAFADVPEASTTEFGFPPILGLSNTGGFQFML